MRAWLPLTVFAALSVALFLGLTAYDRSSDAASYAHSRAFVQAAERLCNSLTTATLINASNELLHLPDAAHYHRGLKRLAIDWKILAAHPSDQARKQASLAAHHLNIKACMHTPSK